MWLDAMSKADAAHSDSTVRKHRQRGLIPWKPGQSGNPKGRPKGSRNKLSEEFFRDLCDAWQAFGKPALMSAAWTNPTDFVRMVAQLMPKDVEVAVTKIRAERMSSAELEALISRCRDVGEDPLEAEKDPDEVFRVD
jgi:hypothetical protein